MLQEAMSIKINEIVYRKSQRGERVVTLSLGEGFFNLPKFDIDDEMNLKGAHYVDSRGLIELRTKLAQRLSDTTEYSLDAANILITSGSKLGIFQCLKAFLDPGDEVLLVEPAWLSYQSQCEMAQLKVKRVPQSTTLKQVEEFISENTKGIILNNPNNPSGIVYEKEELVRLMNLTNSLGLKIFLDEAYSDFILKEDLKIDTKISEMIGSNLIIINSFSKSFGLSGWRVGYIVATAENIEKLVPFNQHLATCAPSILQYLLTENFDVLVDSCGSQAREMTKKCIRIREYAESLGFECSKSRATFYFLLKVGDQKMNDTEFSLSLLEEKNIAVVPGSSYGESTRGYVRIGVGKEEEETIYKALDEINDFCREKNIQ